MADKCGIYQHLWHPDELGILIAEQLIEPLSKGLLDMEERPDYYKQFNSPNYWGTYEQFIPWIRKYLAACKEFPESIVHTST